MRGRVYRCIKMATMHDGTVAFVKGVTYVCKRSNKDTGSGMFDSEAGSDHLVGNGWHGTHLEEVWLHKYKINWGDRDGRVKWRGR